MKVDSQLPKKEVIKFYYLKKYLLDYQRLDNKYTKAMFIGRTNPANSIWPNKFKKIIEVMDNLGWHE